MPACPEAAVYEFNGVLVMKELPSKSVVYSALGLAVLVGGGFFVFRGSDEPSAAARPQPPTAKVERITDATNKAKDVPDRVTSEPEGDTRPIIVRDMGDDEAPGERPDRDSGDKPRKPKKPPTPKG